MKDRYPPNYRESDILMQICVGDEIIYVHPVIVREAIKVEKMGSRSATKQEDQIKLGTLSTKFGKLRSGRIINAFGQE